MENITSTEEPVSSQQAAAFELSILITDVAIILMAIFAIYVGSHFSLRSKEPERLSTSEALKVPLYLSVTLFGLFLIFKNVDKDLINTVLSGYFTLSGVFALTATLEPVALEIASKFFSQEQLKKEIAKIELPKSVASYIMDEPLSLTIPSVMSLIVSTIFAGWYLLSKNWIANNFLCMGFSIQGIALMSLNSYTVGCLLLGGLFFYDIYWVFYTEVMVTVAKSFEAPIKLLFPRDIFAEVYKFSMLGLGDIVIPGIFIALLLHYDHWRAGRPKHSNFSKPYFNVCFIWYTVGLITTIAVMHIFRHAQPALLYLVPACIFSSFGLALKRGEVDSLMAFEMEEPEKEKQEKKE